MRQTPPYYLIHLDPPPRGPEIFVRRGEAWPELPAANGEFRMEIAFLRSGAVHTRLFDGAAPHWAAEEDFLTFTLPEAPRPLFEEETAAWVNTVHCAILPEHITDHAACERIGNLLKTAGKPVDQKAMIRSLKLRTVMYECFSILTEQAVLQAQERLQQISRLQSPYTKRAKEYLDANLHRRVPVAEVAAHAGVSYDHLNRLFRQELNMTMLEYANRARIRRVEQLITVDGLSLEEAGERVGIQDAKYLSRLFHRYTGISAADYRRIYRARQEV